MGVHVGAMRIDLHLPEAGSLKGRRAILNKARAALQRDLGVAVAQVDDTEQWQRATLAVATVAGSPAGVDRVLDRVVAIVERDPRVVVVAATAGHAAPSWAPADPVLDGLAADAGADRDDGTLSDADQALLAEWTEPDG